MSYPTKYIDTLIQMRQTSQEHHIQRFGLQIKDIGSCYHIIMKKLQELVVLSTNKIMIYIAGSEL